MFSNIFKYSMLFENNNNFTNFEVDTTNTIFKSSVEENLTSFVEFKELPTVKCRLLDSFKNGEYLSHDETFHIANGYFNRCQKGNTTYKQIIRNTTNVINANSSKKPGVAVNNRLSMVDVEKPYITKCCDHCKYHAECGKNYIINT